MILDEYLEFCDATALNTGAAGTYNIGDVIDTGSVARDIGSGEPLYLVAQVTTGITVASSAGTVTLRLVSDAVTTPDTSTATVHITSAAYATSTTAIAAGTVLLAVAIPMEGNAYERYLGVQQITGTTAINAGAVNVFLTKDVSKYKAYANAI